MSYYCLKNMIECDKCFFEELLIRYDYKMMVLDSAICEALKQNKFSIPIWLNSETEGYAEWMEIFEFFDGNGLTYEYKDGKIYRAHFNLPAAKRRCMTFKNI